ncbi:MAG: sensor histidine kinase [Candidatus Zhuqueibacterota bacterium]
MKYVKAKISNRLFWALHISGWTTLFLAYIFIFYSDRLNNSKVMAGLFITDTIGFVITYLLRLVYKKINYSARSILSLSGVVIVASLIASNLWLWTDIFCSIPLHGAEYLMNRLTVRYYISSIWSHLFVCLLWSALYFSIKLWQEWMVQKERTEQANALAQSAQLQMLRYQLNPHFLFNSLNSIRALVDEDQKSAKRMITELSEFLRYSLTSKNFKDVPLNNEIEAIRHYFAIEKIRYEDKLIVEFEIDPLAEDYPVLSFLIHPLIENAIKYGMQTSPMPLKIQIHATVVDGSRLKIRVCNTGKWIEPSQHLNTISTGIGLNNIRQRLENAFPEHHAMTITENDGVVCVALEIENNSL